MNHHWRRLLALLLTLTTVFSLLPTGFALESAEEPAASQERLEEPELAEASTDTEAPAQSETPAETETPEPSETPAEPDESEQPETSTEQEASADTEDPSADGSQPQQEAPSPSAGSYSQLTLEGTWDYESAFAAQELLSDALVADGKSCLVMDETVLDCAMTRAAELAVCFQETRPSGEDWSTVLGDAGVKATFYAQAISADAESAQQIYDIWKNDSEVYALLSSDSCKGIGIGCFSQPGGTRYWVLIVTNVLTSLITSHENVTGIATVDYQSSLLGDAVLTLSKTALDVGETAQASFAIANGSDFFIPTEDMISYSSDSSAVTIDGQGRLAANAPGSANITAALKDTDKSASVSVTAELNLTIVTLSQVSNQNGSVKLTWKPVTGATNYQVWRKVSGGKWTKLSTVGTETSYADTTAVSGTTYIYTVRALYVADGKTVAQGDYDRTGLTILCLATPKLSSAKASSTGITLQWTAVAGAKSYDVYRKTGSSSSWTKVATVNAATSCTDCNVTAKTQYTYTVRAKADQFVSAYLTGGISATATDTVKTESYVARSAVKFWTESGSSYKEAGKLAAGASVNVISGWSKTIDGVNWYMMSYNGGIYYIQSSDLLATPKITALSNTAAGLKVTWSKVGNGNGYYLYYRTDSSSWSRLASINSSGTTSYVVPDSKLTSGQSYTFTVRAYYGKVMAGYDRTGWSGTYLKTPALTSAVPNDKDAITVTWEAVAGAQSYALYRKTDSSGWSKIATVKSDTTSYKDTGVTTMTVYTYSVRASSGKLLSSYDSTGVSAAVIPNDKVTPYVVTSEVKYRTGPGTGYSSPGSLKAGTVVQVISDWSKTANGYTWYQIKLNNIIQYVASEFLLGTPKLNNIAARNGGITITWGKAANATGYVLYRKTSSTGWSRIANLQSSVLSYTDDSLSSGTTYTYTVRAVCGSVQSRYDTKGLSLCYLTTPKLTSATAADKGITINWSRVTGAQGYYIYRKQSGGSWSRIAQVSSGDTISYLDSSNLIKGVTYVYTVRAFSGSSQSYYQTSGISVKATATLNPVTKDYVTTGDVYYRDPDTHAKVDVLKKGTTVKVVPGITKKVDDTTYYMILIKNDPYYVSSKWLKEK